MISSPICQHETHSSLVEQETKRLSCLLTFSLAGRSCSTASPYKYYVEKVTTEMIQNNSNLTEMWHKMYVYQLRLDNQLIGHGRPGLLQHDQLLLQGPLLLLQHRHPVHQGLQRDIKSTINITPFKLPGCLSLTFRSLFQPPSLCLNH